MPTGNVMGEVGSVVSTTLADFWPFIVIILGVIIAFWIADMIKEMINPTFTDEDLEKGEVDGKKIKSWGIDEKGKEYVETEDKKK
jgi:hypothetical protein